MATAPTSGETLLAQLRWRYAVKKFDPARRIDAPTWRALEEALVLTPSSYGLQPWRFVVVRDAAVKRRIREAAEAEERIFYESRAPDEWLRALGPLGTDWHKPFLEIAPALIVVFRIDYGLEREPGGTERQDRKSSCRERVYSDV